MDETLLERVKQALADTGKPASDDLAQAVASRLQASGEAPAADEAGLARQVAAVAPTAQYYQKFAEKPTEPNPLDVTQGAGGMALEAVKQRLAEASRAGRAATRLAPGAGVAEVSGAASSQPSAVSQPGEPSPGLRPGEPPAAGAPTFQDPYATEPAPVPALPPGLSPDLKVQPGFISQVGALDFSKLGKAPAPEEYGLTEKTPEPVDKSADTLKAALDEHRQVMNSLVADYRTARSDIDRKELWEGIVQGVALLASGLYGLRHNVDMSGVRLSPTDWEAKRKLELAQLKEFSDQADKQFGNSKDYAAALHQQAREAGDKLDKDWAQNARLFEAASRAYNERVDQTAKVWESKYRDTNLHNDVAYKSAELELQGAKLEDLAKRTDNQAQRTALLARAKDQDKAAKLLTDFNAGLARGAAEKSSDGRKALAPALQQQAESFRQLTGAYPPGVTPDMFVTKGGWFSGPGSADVRDVATARGKVLASHPSGVSQAGEPSQPPAASQPVQAGTPPPVRMTAPNGTVYMVPADKADAARQQGWK